MGKRPSISVQMINGRAETAATKLAFRDPLTNRRCLIPADGFYEWQRSGKAKQPYCFEVNDGELFSFAGLWDRWKDPSGNWVKTCSISRQLRTLRLQPSTLLEDSAALYPRLVLPGMIFTKVKVFSLC
jgi:hypothetical protein